MSQPNVILILTDQQRLSTLSTYGQTPCMTPNLDKLAGRSIIFDNAYTPCPLCTPARASLMTGLYPHQHGMTSNTGNTSCAVHNLRDRPELLSRRLQSAGYDCLYTGKWHLGWRESQLFCEQIPPALPRDVGFIGHNCPGHGGPGFNFQDYKDYLQRLGMTNNIREKLRLGKGFVPSYGIQELPEEGTVPYFLAQHSIERIDEFADSGKPFFLWHNFWGPHEGYFIPEEFYEMYRHVSIPEWPNYRWPSDQIEGPHRIAINPSHSELKWENWEEVIRYYYGFMTLIDKQIGR
ncbi:MAG: sulfatase-like hydrolase/transferase, partial [Phycisphaeraceae bacterium JB051]